MKLLIENWRGFLAESKLRVFDFDDTIAKSDSNIHVTTDTGKRITMTPAEYATHKINPDYEYDYSEFSDVINPREVKQITRIIRNALGAGGTREIAILTARSPEAEGAIKKYLKQIGIDTSRITFKLLGNSDPQAKADWVRGKIENGATDVLFFDDSGKNVEAVQNLADEYPDIRIKARRVKYAEDLNEEILTEKCWPGYEKKGMKKMFGKMYPNCVKKSKKKKKKKKKTNEEQELYEDQSSYFPWLKDLEERGGEVLMGPDFQNVGSGAFRAVFRPKGDEEHVVKLSKDPRNNWMNKIESETANSYPELFPKTFAHADDWEWVVQEAVEVITRRKEDLVRRMLMTSFPSLYVVFKMATIPDGELIDYWLTMADAAKSPYTTMGKKMFDFGIKHEKAFIELASAISKFNIDVDDLGYGNIGINEKGELRILDTSVLLRPVKEAGRSDRYDPRNYVGRDQGRRFTHGSDGKRPPTGLYGEKKNKRGASPSYCKSTPCDKMGFTQKASCKSQGIKDCYRGKKNEGRDPKKGTGKKPKGSGRRLYTDENPSDTVSVKFSTVQDIKDTLSKASFKSKSHKRQSQIINLIHQRARAAYQNAKDPKVKARLKKSYEYAKKRKEASKRKTQRMNKK